MISSEQLERLLPLACEWAEQQEKFILENGVPLDREYKNFASSIGVQDIGRVRLLKVDEIPAPKNPQLKSAAEVLGLIGKYTLAITYRHGIYVRADHWYDKKLVVHELCHTMQYERLGGIQPFLEQYLSECLSEGYTNSKLEQEAVIMERLISKHF
ncbi:hypothetical protein DC20_19020 [Rufibacter tibetensis]|uniref:DUF4157 domain-containing protein n=1 Tax=Rufibacter tibetensis TaxID=512763 RepID=A0A0P0CHU0_9BACT|nr:hypothetical protein DC20_19020 [Rufibacter tibetensis]